MVIARKRVVGVSSVFRGLRATTLCLGLAGLAVPLAHCADPTGSDDGTRAEAAGAAATASMTIRPVRGTSMCVDIENASPNNGARAHLWDCHGGASQQFVHEGGQLKVFGNKCLDVEGGRDADDTRVQIWDCTPGNRNQQWTRDGQQWRWTGTNKCLDLPYGEAKTGNFMHIWTCVGNDYQRWDTPGAGAPAPPPPPPPPPPSGTTGGTASGEWRQVWSDEFDGTALDESKWAYENWAPGMVNNELQRYTERRRENVRVEGGHLVIEARRDGFQGSEYSSGRIKTQGKASWKYGKMEARIQLPGGLGTWPAFWMMPDDQSRGWPACGELDIMEEVGFEPEVIHASAHSKSYNWIAGPQRTGITTLPGATTGYHTYAMEWSEAELKFFVDGRQYYAVSNNSGGNDDNWPFTKNFHVILNLVVGGDWGAAKGVDPNIWPRQMLVDYVRVFQR